MRWDGLPELNGQTLFRMLARAVWALSMWNANSSLTLPYPEDAQLALDRLVLACAHQRIDPPAGVPDLITWCAERTADQWPFPPPEGVHPGTRLVDRQSRMLTRACAEVVADTLANMEELAITMMSDVLAAASPDAAARRRDFLIRTVVVDRAGHQVLFGGDAGSALVFKKVRQLYGPAPAAWVVDHTLSLCPTCGLLAIPSEGGIQWCESETCPTNVPVTVTYNAPDCQVLEPVLRLFLALPGRTEASLLGRLASLGSPAVPVDLARGRYRVVMHSGDERTFRVYDRTQPVLLADRVVRDCVSLAVVPHEVLDARPDFRETFLASFPVDTGVDLISDDILVSRVGDGSASMEEV